MDVVIAVIHIVSRLAEVNREQFLEPRGGCDAMLGRVMAFIS